MAHEKLKIARADADNLVSNLRGEVGEVITTYSRELRAHRELG